MKRILLEIWCYTWLLMIAAAFFVGASGVWPGNVTMAIWVPLLIVFLSSMFTAVSLDDSWS